MQYNQEII